MASVDPYMPCPCGSGQKFKWCCQKVETYAERAQRMVENGQYEAAIKPLNDEWRLLTNRLEEIGYPTTLDGAKAMARAAIANVPRRRDGGLIVGDGACYGLLLRVSEFLAGSVVA